MKLAGCLFKRQCCEKFQRKHDAYDYPDQLNKFQLSPARIAISYTYDDNGNIETISQSGDTAEYFYDELNQLVRENNEFQGETITYSYDIGGNLQEKNVYAYTQADPITLAPTDTVSYGYDTTWKDKMVSFDGQSITYDAIGNPTAYDGNTYTWEGGRQLAGIDTGSSEISYEYNDSGIRIQKTVDGVTTEYHLVGEKVTYEKTGSDYMYFNYDGDGNVFCVNYNGTRYFYERNLQGDVIGILDNTGTKVVSYTYDSWGNILSITGSQASTIGQENPYRYRGYRYDSETGMYYLNARYYVPEWGRFLNADSIFDTESVTIGYNIFSYCKSNPIKYFDPSGNFPVLVFAAIYIGFTIVACLSEEGRTRTETALNQPTLYNIGNWLTSGTFDAVKGTVAPEKPLSLQHWKDSLHTASLVLPATAGLSAGVKLAAEKNFEFSVLKIGRIKPNYKKGNGYYGIQYKIGERVRSFELQNHPGHDTYWHWQFNSWNMWNYTSRSKIHWTWYGRRM